MLLHTGTPVTGVAIREHGSALLRASPAPTHVATRKQQLSRSRVNTSFLSDAAVVTDVQMLHTLADNAALSPAALILPVLGASVAGVAALKFYLYSQLEVIAAKMLGKYVPTGGNGARVIQLGGGTRELYYYPKDIMTVIAVGESVNKGLMEQAGMTAAVPTIVRQQPITDLGFQPDSSIDAVVALGVLGQLSEQQRKQCMLEISRVLKPGKPLVFIEPVKEGGSPLRSLVGVSGGKEALAAAQLEAWQQDPAFTYVQWDVALEGQDPHAVGVAVRSERQISRDDDVVGGQKQRRSKQPKTAKGFSSSGAGS